MLDRLRQELITVTANVERARRLGPPNWPLNEANTKRIVIEPILRALGYDELDYLKEPSGIGADYLDYLVLPTTDQKWVLEAKEWDARLTERFERQAVNYASNNGAQWAVLTNGRTWWFYNRSAGGDLIQQRVYELEDVAETERAVEVLSRLSRDSVVAGDLDKKFRAREIEDALRSQLRSGNRRIVRTIKTEIGRLLDKHIEVEEIVEALNAVVPDSPQRPNAERESELPITPAPQPAFTAGSFIAIAQLAEKPELCTGSRPICVRGLGADEIETRNWRDVAVFAIERSPAAALAKLPFLAGPDAERYFLNYEPRHSEDRPMRAPRAVSLGGASLYAELHYSARNLIAVLCHWLSSVGVDPGGIEVKIAPRSRSEELG